jgi:hypothetical protein
MTRTLGRHAVILFPRTTTHTPSSLTHGNEKQFQVVIGNRDKSVPKWNSAGLKVGHGDCEARNWEWIHRSKLEARIVAKAKGAACSSEKELSKQGGVSRYCGLAIYIKKYLKAKEELWKLKYFTMQKYNVQKIL